ncbi:MFS transporter [Actinoplanes sp. HUAS TT8]|uniref:MFS transporter n=1 Tax=Actinoplanes sp. HUAS TT8 TaxID=3447453 RepID=UPI003F51E1EF
MDRVDAGPRVVLPRWAGRPDVVAGLLAGALSLMWGFWLARDAGDLAAQYAWTSFVRHHPGSAYNLSWYGGMHPASYSVLSPYLMAWLGVRTTGVLACTGTATLAGYILLRSGISRPLLPALWLSVAVWGNLAAGRVTYLIGLVFALLAAICLLSGSGRHRPWPVAAAVLGTIATLCSPVAGLFIEVLAAAMFLTGRRRHALWIGSGPPVVVGTTSMLFPFSGVQPFPWYAALVTVGAAVAVAVLTPDTWRTVRAGAWVYAVGVTLCWVLPTPIGSNVERLAVLLSAAFLICAAAIGQPLRSKTIATYVIATALAAWTVIQPLVDYARTSSSAPATVDEAQPLVTALQRLNAEQGRVEVVPLRTHWEAVSLAPHVNLARGWNRQTDVHRNPLFYDGTLTADSYRQWLHNWSVGFVVLPTAEPDNAGIAEARIITAGQTWLPLVWSDANWRVYQVEGTDPLASTPATVTYAGPAAVTVHLPEAGTTLLRIAWSPWLTVHGVGARAACLTQKGSWTELVAQAAGTYTVEARYTLDRGTPCPERTLSSHRRQ